jgi:hypothetical protein
MGDSNASTIGNPTREICKWRARELVKIDVPGCLCLHLLASLRFAEVSVSTTSTLREALLFSPPGEKSGLGSAGRAGSRNRQGLGYRCPCRDEVQFLDGAATCRPPSHRDGGRVVFDTSADECSGAIVNPTTSQLLLSSFAGVVTLNRLPHRKGIRIIPGQFARIPIGSVPRHFAVEN